MWATDEGPPVKQILRRESYTIDRSRSWRSTTAKRNCTVRSDGVLTSPKEKPPELALPREDGWATSVHDTGGSEAVP